MAVDDVAVFARNAELVENHVAHILPVAELVIVSLVLGVGILVGYEISLEGGHRRLVEQRRVRSAPKIPYIVRGVFFGDWIGVPVERRTDQHPDVVQKFLPFVAASHHVDLLQGAVLVEVAPRRGTSGWNCARCTCIRVRRIS